MSIQVAVEFATNVPFALEKDEIEMECLGNGTRARWEDRTVTFTVPGNVIYLEDILSGLYAYGFESEHFARIEMKICK